MDICHTEGIILHSLPFQDYHQIVTVFSAEEGLIKFIIKNGYLSKKKHRNPASPLTRAEFFYIKKRSELYLCQEIEILSQHFALRQDLNRLEASCDMLQAIQTSQWQGKPSPDLYQLLRVYLEKMPSAADPFVISSSFRLKILKYEGLLRISSNCSTCQQMLNESYWEEGESFCSLHASPQAIIFQEDEKNLMEQLMYCRHFFLFNQLTLSPGLATKIKSLFQKLHS